jgi:thiamine-monophosphate kinase
MLVSQLGERRLLARIQSRFEKIGQHAGHVVVGIGDDAAVIRSRRNTQTVLTTDAQVEGVHFDRRFSAAADIGFRSLAVNVSDLAAMGAMSRWALVSLVLPDTTEVTYVDSIVDGIAQLADTLGMAVIGGNLTRSPGPLLIDVTAIGEVAPRRLLTRGGGRPGDALFVSGTIGAAAAGLEMLRRETGLEALGLIPGNSCIDRYRRPEPRARLGVAIAQAKAARAAIDLSDGLADAAAQLAGASGCGVEIEASMLPIEAAAREWWTKAGLDPVVAALSGGDDYELLVAVPPTWRGRLRHATTRVSAPALTRIGRLTKAAGTRLLIRDCRREPLPGGFEHFRPMTD